MRLEPVTSYQTPGAVFEVPQNGAASNVASAVLPEVTDGAATGIALTQSSLGGGPHIVPWLILSWKLPVALL
jgi:hypothetical protein